MQSGGGWRFPSWVNKEPPAGCGKGRQPRLLLVTELRPQRAQRCSVTLVLHSVTVHMAKLIHAVVSPRASTNTTAYSCPEPQQGKSLDPVGQPPPLPVCHGVRLNSQAQGGKTSLKHYKLFVAGTHCGLPGCFLISFVSWFHGHPGQTPESSSLVNSTVAGNAPHAEAQVINFYEHLRLKIRLSASAVVDVIGLTWLDKRKLGDKGKK